jgi:pimeloyl-ACP methyl ester carboxylesterase
MPSTYVLIHGAGGSAWDWHLVEPALRRRGHDVVAMDLPCEDDSAGLGDYVDTVLEAIGERPGPFVIAGHSFGGYTAPLVAARVPAERLVLVAAMVPAPAETAREYSERTGYEEAFRAQRLAGDGPHDVFLNGVPPDLAKEAIDRERDQSDTPGGEPWPLDAWPDVPTRFLVCRDDRMFPADWLRGVVRDRLGIAPDEMDGGHCAYLSHATELAAWLDRPPS